MNKQLAEGLEKNLGISQEQVVREEYEMIILKSLFKSKVGKLLVFRNEDFLKEAFFNQI